MEHAKKAFHKPHNLSLFGFLMITSSMVISIYIYPTFATSGVSLIFFLLFTGFLWFIPVCLASAEMGTGGQGWTNAGVYSWGAAALGKRWGFTMIYLQFMEISIGFVPMLFFITGALKYLFDAPIINTPGWVQFVIVTGAYWILSVASWGGTKITKYFATYGFLCGVLLPTAFLIVLGITFVAQGNGADVHFNAQTFFPDFTKLSTLVIIVSFILSYMGPEASAVHVNHLHKPGRNYPLAILILVLLTIVIGTLASMTIVISIPARDISLNAGILETFKYLLKHYDIVWLGYPLAILVALSAIGEIAAWVNGPVRGMLFAAQQNILPPSWARMNHKHMPIRLMWIQGLLVTFWIAVLIFGSKGGGNVAFFTAMALTVITYLTMYVLLFVSYLVLKSKVPDSANPRKFSMPKWLGWIVCIVGLISTIFAFCISFVRPSEIDPADYSNYLIILVVAYCIIFVIPHIMYSVSKKKGEKWGEVVKEMQEKGHTFIHTKPTGDPD